jgi:hypothetical protein
MHQASPRTLMLLAAFLVLGCGSSTGDDASKFAGTWTFDSGTLTPVCTIVTAPAPFDLSGQSLAITKVDAATLKVDLGTACSVTFKVSGAQATALPNQMCTLSASTPPVTLTSWTLTISGDHIESATMASAFTVCTVNGSGVLSRASADGGAATGG